ncbi:hypothetical protein [Neorhizobium tomejilense]|uniref:hypothetical protein n=1 Tax=Neorhizobium tomejilense TaxID=2093828 RepID=UPI003ECD7EC1
MKFFHWSGLVVAPLAVVLTGYLVVETELLRTSALAASNSVTFPPLEQLEHYTTVRRGITREHMLTSPAALSALKAGQPVPTGSHMVLVDYQSDVLTRYLVAQKIGAGADQWEYQWFCRIGPSRPTKMSPVATPAIVRVSPNNSCSR